MKAFPAFILGISFVAGSYLVSQTLTKARELDRYVSVKGLSEREVAADLAIWPLQFSVVGNDLTTLQREIKKQVTILTDFFKSRGFSTSELNIQSPNIQDSRANTYGNQGNYNVYRYVSLTDVTIRTADLEKLNLAFSEISEVIGKGVIIGSKNTWQPVEYIFTGLNDIKPDMIQEATLNARTAAEKFARDSGSKVGDIRSARQGLFSIQNRDVNTGQIKRVRVVTTIEYFLEN